MVIGLIAALMVAFCVVRIVAVAIVDRQWDGEGAIFLACLTLLLVAWVSL